jgi:hypothetical protein
MSGHLARALALRHHRLMEDIENADLAEFLAEFPLYRPFPVQAKWVPEKIPVPNSLRPVLTCRVCTQRRSFALSDLDFRKGSLSLEIDKVTLLRVVCTHCQKERQTFALLPTRKESTFRIQKVGQFPPIRLEIESGLKPLLDESNADLFSKGLTAEGHGFGIGAFAYYRRVVENIIGKLLASVATFAEQEGNLKFREALEGATEQPRASDKIEAVKDLLPASLRPGGFNPLGKLYEVLSGGIHALTDEECLASAEALRVVLSGLVSSIAQQNAAQAGYRSAANKLLAVSARMKKSD